MCYSWTMSASALPNMTADEFIAWSHDQPKGVRHELDSGVIVTLEAERVAHVRAKQRIYTLMADAIAAKGLPCEAFVDGLAVVVDENTVYEPDALARCGEPLGGETVRVVDPSIVVEVLSPSSQSRDSGLKLANYFRIASLRHYLIATPDLRIVIHHRRQGDGDILTRIVRAGPIHLDPPGIVLDRLFPADIPAEDGR